MTEGTVTFRSNQEKTVSQQYQEVTGVVLGVVEAWLRLVVVVLVGGRPLTTWGPQTEVHR